MCDSHPPHCNKGERPVFIPKGCAGQISCVTNAAWTQRFAVWISGHRENLCVFTGKGENNTPMNANGSPIVYFGPFAEACWLVVGAKHAQDGRNFTRSDARSSTIHNGQAFTTVVSAEDGADRDFNDGICTLLYCPQFQRPLPKGSCGTLLPGNYFITASVTCNAGWLQRVTLQEPDGKVLCCFQGRGKGDLTCGGKRSVNFGPFRAHQWIIVKAEFASDGHTFKPCKVKYQTSKHGSRTVVKVCAEDGADEDYNDTITTLVLTPC